jgi:hypothetical protein
MPYTVQLTKALGHKGVDAEFETFRDRIRRMPTQIVRFDLSHATDSS